MSSVNKVILIGNLGRDPELRHTPAGTAVCALSLATTRKWKDKNSGDRSEETEWHRVVFFDRLAEIVEQYCAKGQSIYVEGRLKTRKYTDKDGVEKYATEIVAEQLTMIGSAPAARDGGSDPSASRTRTTGAPVRQPDYPRAARAPVPAPRSRAQAPSTGFDDMDDDIPF